MSRVKTSKTDILIKPQPLTMMKILLKSSGLQISLQQKMYFMSWQHQVSFFLECSKEIMKIESNPKVLLRLPPPVSRYFYNCNFRNVTMISSCWVNTTSRWGIKQLEFSFGSIFLLFFYIWLSKGRPTISNPECFI